MDNKILSKVKEQLLFNSKIYKERQELIKEYVSNIERITYDILGEKGKEMIDKYPNAIQFYSEITIPGYYKHLGATGYYGSIDNYQISLPYVIDGLNSIYQSSLNGGSEEDKVWYIKIRENLTENGNKVGVLCENLDDAINSKTTLGQLQKYFPEAYNLYKKFKNEKRSGALHTLHAQAYPLSRAAITDTLHEALKPQC